MIFVLIYTHWREGPSCFSPSVCSTRAEAVEALRNPLDWPCQSKHRRTHNLLASRQLTLANHYAWPVDDVINTPGGPRPREASSPMTACSWMVCQLSTQESGSAGQVPWNSVPLLALPQTPAHKTLPVQ